MYESEMAMPEFARLARKAARSAMVAEKLGERRARDVAKLFRRAQRRGKQAARLAAFNPAAD